MKNEKLEMDLRDDERL